MKNIFKITISTILIAALLVASAPAATVQARLDDFYLMNDILFYDPNPVNYCSAGDSSIAKLGTDYKGGKILSEGQLSAIEANKSVYIQAADQKDIPWQMLAVTHLRETGLARKNPSNGQGIYQFVNKGGGPYPTGEVDEAEFLRQTLLAADFLKNKAAGSNVEGNRNLTKNATPEIIKDTFFSYNGRSSKYAAQATGIGFSSTTHPYEGSPYVMNMADEKRDPSVNTTTWGQVKRDYGPIEYPANKDHGAYVVYASLTGGSANTSSCTSDGNSISGTVREKIVTLATQELNLWESKQLTGNGRDFHKYTHGGHDNWCAWFVSWVFKQANYPLSDSKTGAVPAVTTIQEIGKKGDKFEYHEKNSGYKPQPGDIVVQKINSSHVSIVTAAAEDGKITIIGGNQGYGRGSGQASSFVNSSVTEWTFHPKDNNKISGYVSPKGN